MFKEWADAAGLPPKAMYSVREVAVVTGVPVSTMYDEIALRRIRVFRTGRTMRIRAEWVDEWLEAGSK